MSTETERTSSDPDAKEHFFRQFKQEESCKYRLTTSPKNPLLNISSPALQEHMTRLKENVPTPAERASLTDRCLAGISQLSDEVKDASAYLPAYDQRTYSTVSIKKISFYRASSDADGSGQLDRR